MDPSVRSHVLSQTDTTFGWFVQNGADVRLTDRHGRVWNLDYVSILQGDFGFDAEGVSKLPRPRVVDDRGQIIVDGDRVIIDFLDGSVSRPLVRGGVRSISSSDFLPYNHGSENYNRNRWAMRVQALDDNGDAAGRVDIEIAHSDQGHERHRVTHGFEITATENLDNINNAVRIFSMLFSPDGVDFVSNGSTDQVILGREFLYDLYKALEEVAAAMAAIPFSPGPAFTSFLTKLYATQTSGTDPNNPGGAPYLSELLRTE